MTLMVSAFSFLYASICYMVSLETSLCVSLSLYLSLGGKEVKLLLERRAGV